MFENIESPEARNRRVIDLASVASDLSTCLKIARKMETDISSHGDPSLCKSCQSSGIDCVDRVVAVRELFEHLYNMASGYDSLFLDKIVTPHNRLALRFIEMTNHSPIMMMGQSNITPFFIGMMIGYVYGEENYSNMGELLKGIDFGEE